MIMYSFMLNRMKKRWAIDGLSRWEGRLIDICSIASDITNSNALHNHLNGSASNARDQCGQTALPLAVKSSRRNVIKPLLDHDARIDVWDNIGQKTALHLAAESIDCNSIDLCSAEFAQTHDDSVNCSHRHDIVQFLSQQGTDTSMTTSDGKTARSLERMTKLLEVFLISLQLLIGVKWSMETQW